MKQQILNRYSNAVIYECELPDGTENAMRAALIKAVSEKANLTGANLIGANLIGAKLRGAYLIGDRKLIGNRPYFSIGPIGSRLDTLKLWLTDKGPYLANGCFSGTFEEFAKKLSKGHGDNDHAKEYKAALLMCEAHAAIWTPSIEVVV